MKNKEVAALWALGREATTEHLKSQRGDDSETYLVSYAMGIAVRWYISNGGVGEGYKMHLLFFFVDSTPSVTTKRHLNMAMANAIGRDAIHIRVPKLPRTREEALVMMDQHLMKVPA